MYKGVVAALLLVAFTLVGVLACESVEDIDPVEVLFDNVTASGNVSAVTIEGDFTIKNPNDAQVTLDSFEYVLAVEDKDVGYLQFADDRSILAEEEVSISGTVVVSFQNLVANAMFSHGLSQGEALQTILPYWKKMGGQNPVEPMQELWDSVDPEVTFTASGSAYIEAEDQRVTANFIESITK